ncbi:hypothetical protein GGI20_005563 [Coemansia sp. BCRC 34301]|nr:hypothetical protein GGI20_005563 [Coemansia sp. BCRC 34301]
MRYFVVLVVLSCLMALCHAASSAYRKVTLENNNGRESYDSDTLGCYKVGSKFREGPVNVRVTGGKTAFYSDSMCHEWLGSDETGNGNKLIFNSRIKGYRAVAKQ